jgi:S-DNA-T family DNA segregation ATPase FtsK/SpoIIIE
MQFVVTGVDGVVCATNVESDGPDLSEELSSGTLVLRMRKPTLLETINAVTSRRELAKTQSRQINLEDSPQPQASADDKVDQTSDNVEINLPTQMSSDESDFNEVVLGAVSEPTPGSISPAHGDAPPAEFGLTAEQLRGKYQVMLDTFAEFKVKVEQAPEAIRFQQGAGFYQLRVRPAVGVQASQLTSRAEDLKLRLELPAGFEIRAYSDLGNVVIEVPKLPAERYDVKAESLWSRTEWPDAELFSPIGEDITGDVVGINFSSSMTPHLLIAGTTGSGKSVALESILAGLCLRQPSERLHLHLVDPKGTELLRFEGSPHLHGDDIAISGQEAIEILEALVQEMQDRSTLFRELRVSSLIAYNAKCEPEKALPWHVIVLDEYADLVSDKEERKKIEALLQRLAQKGRSAGIHVVVATQRPSADIITSVIRSNLPAQLALRVKSATDSRIILDEAGAEALAGHGDALFRTEAGVRRIQCAIIK